MNAAKIQLSEDELQLVSNANFILTKNRIIQKVYGLFGALASDYRNRPFNNVPSQVTGIAPKISRGEQYGGLPYVMLDYPRYFTKEDIFAIRTMFWWGNHFSITLHLKGSFKSQLEDKIIEGDRFPDREKWHVQLSGDEWQHHPTADSHRLLASFRSKEEAKADIKKSGFLKISYYIPIQEWSNAEKELQEKFDSLNKVVG